MAGLSMGKNVFQSVPEIIQTSLCTNFDLIASTPGQDKKLKQVAAQQEKPAQDGETTMTTLKADKGTPNWWR